MATERIYHAVLDVAARRQGAGRFQSHLDIGAGRGELIKLFQERFQTQSSACDYTDQLIKLPGQKVDIVDLNLQPLPYPDATFDIVTARVTVFTFPAASAAVTVRVWFPAVTRDKFTN